MAKRKPWRVEIVFPGDPRTKSNSHFFSGGRVYIPKEIKAYEAALKDFGFKVMKTNKRKPTAKLVRFTATYYYGTKRTKDLLNLPKSSADAMNEVVYKDDFQIHEAHLYRHLDRKNPRVHIIIEEMSDKEWEQG